MPRIFISHSSRDNAWAEALRKWLDENGWPDVFLDLDPERGLKPGQRWQEALRTAADHCEVVLFLVSSSWAESRWCLAEYLLAKQLGKRCVPVLVEAGALAQMPVEMASEHQAVDLVSDENGYERLRIGLRAAGLDANSFAYDPTRAPYPGLRPFGENDAAVFFGRDTQILAALDALRRMRASGVRRVLVILGASGSGKSSLMRAGLWPRLMRERRNFYPLDVLRPERAPLSGNDGLYRVFETAMQHASDTGNLAESLPRTRGAIRQYLQDTGGAGLAGLVDAIANAHRQIPVEGEEAPNAPSVILSIDQAEELWNADAGKEAPTFLDLISEAIETVPRLLVMMTVRSPSYPVVQNDGRFREHRQELFTLGAMPLGSFRSLIERPATLARLRLEPALIDRLLVDSKGSDSLPLLAFTLERLYREFGSDGDLTEAEYNDLGGVSGAIAASVENAILTAQKHGLAVGSQAVESLMRSIFLPHLVRVDERGELLGRIADLSELPTGSRLLVDSLAEQRLLIKDRRASFTVVVPDVASEDGDSRETVEISHEALLREWPLLKGWLIEEREHLVWRQRVAQAFNDWMKAPPKTRPIALLTGLALDAARHHRKDWVESLPGDQRKFVLESVKAEAARAAHAAKLRRILLGASVAAAFVFAVLGTISWIAGNRAREAQSRAEAESQRNLAQRLAFESSVSLQTSPRRAALLAAEAARATLVPAGIVTPEGRAAANRALAEFTGISYQGYFNTSVTDAVFSKDESLIAAADYGGMVQIFRLGDPYPPGPQFVLKTDEFSRIVGFDGLGRSFITHSRTLECAPGWFVNHRKTNGCGPGLIWHLEPGKKFPLQPSVLPGSPFECISISRDSALLAAATADQVILYDLADFSHPRELRRLQKSADDKVSVLEFSSDNDVLASGSLNGWIELWTLRGNEGKSTAHFQSASSSNFLIGSPPIDMLRISEDKSALVSASGEYQFSSDRADLSAKLWTLKDLKPSGKPRLLMHEQAITSVNILSKSRAVITTSYDGALRRWPLDARGSSDPELLVSSRCNCGPSSLSGSILSAAVLADESFAAISTWDGVTRLVKLDDARNSSIDFRGNDATEQFVRVSPSGKWLLSAARDGSLHFWTTSGGTFGLDPTLIGNWRTGYVASALSEAGRTALLIGPTQVEVWDLSDLGSPRQALTVKSALAKTKCPICGTAMSPDGRWIVVQSDSAPDKSNVYATDGSTSFEIASRTWTFGAVKFSADSQSLLVESNGAKLYDLSGKQAPPIEVGQPEAHISFDDNVLQSNTDWLSGWPFPPGESGTPTWLWRIDRSGGTAKRFDLPFDGSMGQSRFSPDKRWFVYAVHPRDPFRISNRPRSSLPLLSSPEPAANRAPDVFLVHLDRQADQLEPMRLRGQEAVPTILEFSPDSRWLLSGNNTYAIDPPVHLRLWNLGGKHLADSALVIPNINGHVRAAKFSPDGKFLITIGATEDFARLWRLDTGGISSAGSLRGPLSTRDSEAAIEFSPDSKRVVLSTRDDPRVYLWFLPLDSPTASGNQLQTGDRMSEGMHFSSDSKSLFVTAAFTSTQGSSNRSRGAQLLQFDVADSTRHVTSQQLFNSADANFRHFLLREKAVLVSGGKLRAWPIRTGGSLLPDLSRRVGRNMTWDEWVRSGNTGGYHKTFAQLPVPESVLNRLTERVSAGENVTPAGTPVAELVDWAVEFDDPAICNNLAKSLAMAGNGRESLRTIACALKYFPDTPEYRETRGIAKAQLGDRRGAIEDFKAFDAGRKVTGAELDAAERRKTWIRELSEGRNPFAKKSTQ